MANPHSAKSTHFDVIVLGAGAAGLFAAFTAGRRGKKVLVIEVSNKPGKKILMSGGGRCNFTNLEVRAEHFLCANPHFVKSALSQYTNWHFIGLVAEHGIAYHEKSHGQLFCDSSSKDILSMLLTECESAGVEIRLNSVVSQVKYENLYRVVSNNVVDVTDNLIVATGGLSIPTLGGATGLGYRLAQQFGLEVSPQEAALVPMTLSGKWRDFSSALAGVSVPVTVSVPTKGFSESMLFTHRGLSGPAILQLSNYWQTSDAIVIDLLPDEDIKEHLISAKRAYPNATVADTLSRMLPNSLVKALQVQWWSDCTSKPLHEYRDDSLADIAQQLHHWVIRPSGTEGYRTAEVTRGGVDVAHISSKTMEVKHQPGLFFIGEVLDVTGHLGGYNFQWAWSSGYVAGQSVT